MKQIATIITAFTLIFSCQQKPAENISQNSDYAEFLKASSQVPSALDEEIEFWQTKLTNSPNNFMYLSQLAGLHSQRFKANGKISDIAISDSLYQKVLNINPFGKSNTYRMLSANAVTKHQFQEARDYAHQALIQGEDKAATYYMLFDALMELGEFDQAKSILNIQRNKNSFDYLTRASKFADHEGDLDQAIALMEQAYERVKSDQSIFTWSQSNLADMYGHAGRIEESYQKYLEVLAHDPTHWHSWKGLAWINFAHDKNLSAAKEILRHVDKNSNDPQVKLMLAEIKDYEGNTALSEQLKAAYYSEVSTDKYYGMHNKYLILLESEDLMLQAQAIDRATLEKEKRPTPQMYDLLAWTYLQNDQPKEALELADLFVKGKSFEPDVLYHLGIIYRRNNQRSEGNRFLREALESEFELGPVTTSKIKEALKG